MCVSMCVGMGVCIASAAIYQPKHLHVIYLLAHMSPNDRVTTKTSLGLRIFHLSGRIFCINSYI